MITSNDEFSHIEAMETHKDNINPGDTILYYGVVKTVCSCNIKRGGFCGTTIFGDSFKLGYEPVIKITGLRRR